LHSRGAYLLQGRGACLVEVRIFRTVEVRIFRTVEVRMSNEQQAADSGSRLISYGKLIVSCIAY
jgi:hypothetical protein